MTPHPLATHELAYPDLAPHAVIEQDADGFVTWEGTPDAMVWTAKEDE